MVVGSPPLAEWESRPFEFCPTCFQFAAANDGRWLAAEGSGQPRKRLHDGALGLVGERAEASTFYRWRGGTYGYPGALSESVVSLVDNTHCLHYTRERGLVLNNSLYDEKVRAFVGDPGKQALEFLLIAESPRGYDRSVADRVRIYACDGAERPCARRSYLLGNGSAPSERSEFRVVCSSCPSVDPAWDFHDRVLSPHVLVIGFLCLILVVGPTIAMRRLWVVPPATRSMVVRMQEMQWPRRSKPALVYWIFCLSWLLVLAALLPITLYVWVGIKWPTSDATYAFLPLAPLGVVGMMLTLRSDDPPPMLR